MQITKEQADKVIAALEFQNAVISDMLRSTPGKSITLVGYENAVGAAEALSIMRGLDDGEPVATVKESLTVHKSAEDYLRYRYGAYRGHFAWRELEEAYSQGRYDEEMLQGPYPYPGDATSPQAAPAHPNVKTDSAQDAYSVTLSNKSGDSELSEAQEREA